MALPVEDEGGVRLSYLTVDSAGVIRSCNLRAKELLTYARSELISRHVLTLYADSASGKEKASALLKRFQAGQKIRDEELQMRRADGSADSEAEPAPDDGPAART